MKKYNIVVNGTAYAVEVEEVGQGGGAAVIAPTPAPAAVPAAPAVAPVAAAAPAAPAAAVPTAGAEEITSPMPGTILDVRVTPGQSVKAGDILVILEAMKMENEIMAPRDGVVDIVATTKGSAVNVGDLLVTMK